MKKFILRYIFGELPGGYEDFLQRVKHKFTSNGEEQLIFSYKLTASGLEEINRFSAPKKETHPDEFSYIVAERRIIYSAPTPAHLALRELSLYNNTRLVTENLDWLHEASGVFPYRIDAKHLRGEIGEESLA
jgi:hypothetical protein